MAVPGISFYLSLVVSSLAVAYTCFDGTQPWRGHAVNKHPAQKTGK